MVDGEVPEVPGAKFKFKFQRTHTHTHTHTHTLLDRCTEAHKLTLSKKMMQLRQQLSQNALEDCPVWQNQRLEIAGEAFSDGDIDLIAEAVSKYKVIRTLKVAMCRVTEDQRRNLMGIIKHGDLSSAQFAYLGINEKTAPSIAAAMQESLHLKRLELPFNELGPQGAVWIANGLRDSGVTELLLMKNNLGASGIAPICEVISTGQTSIRYLDFSRNDIGEEGAFRVAAMLEKVPDQIRNLELDNNQILPLGIEAICSSVGPRLEYLSISGNFLTSQASIQALVEMLKSSSLEKLGLNLLGIDDDVLLQIAEGVKSAHHLKHLKLNDNFKITDRGMYEFLKEIGYPVALERMDLHQSGITSICEKFVKEYLKVLQSESAKLMTVLVSSRVIPRIGQATLLRLLPVELIRSVGACLA